MDESVSYPLRLSSILDRGSRPILLHKLSQFTDGCLEIQEGNWHRRFGCFVNEPLTARLQIHDPRTYRAVLFSGTIGAAEAYARGWWSCGPIDRSAGNVVGIRVNRFGRSG